MALRLFASSDVLNMEANCTEGLVAATLALVTEAAVVVVARCLFARGGEEDDDDDGGCCKGEANESRELFLAFLALVEMDKIGWAPPT